MEGASGVAGTPPQWAAGDDTDSDEGAPASECPLCYMEEAQIEHAGAVTSNHALMRRIMAEELKFNGMKPSAVIYNKIARQYNRHVRRAMLGRGLQCERWTGQMVQTHYEYHVPMVPRLLLNKCVGRLECIAKVVDTEVAACQIADPSANGEIIDAKIVNKQCNIAKTMMYLVRDTRIYTKEDMQNMGKLCGDIDLDAPPTSVQKDLLDRAALVQSAAGAGDLACASDLFD